jgi:hypothetical protein
MGVVYETMDLESGQRVALKTLLHFDPAALYRFKQEFRALADVSHPNLVSLHELVATDELLFFTMELVPGVDFLRYTAPTGARSGRATGSASTTSSRSGGEGRSDALETLDPVGPPTEVSPAQLDRLRPALAQLVEGLNALHAAGKLHRDIKPSNVLVTPEGRLVILDFGVATDLSGPTGVDLADEEMVGTAAYIAPEQAAHEPPTTASDWYSVGVMLYEALAGRRPFDGPAIDVITRKSLFDPLPPSRYALGIPADLDALCSALLRRDPEGRPTGAEIRRMLEGSVPEPLSVPPPRLSLMPDAPLLGRDEQMRALRDAFEAVRGGRLSVVRLHGASGMGKSSLATRFVDGLAERGEAIVLRGRAYERESTPFKALDSIVDALARTLIRLAEEGDPVALPPGAAALARLFPVLRAFEPIAAAQDAAEAPAPTARRDAVVALRGLLAELAARQPVVVYIDDAHWGDIDSADLLLDLVRAPFDAPVLVILTHRDEEIYSSPFLLPTAARWPAGTDLRDLRVGPLAHDHACALALRWFDASDSTAAESAEAVARESQGNPLLAEELARSVAGVSAALLPSLGHIRLEKVVDGRLSALSDEARRLVELVAVSARPLPVSVAGAAAGVFDGLEDTVSGLRARRFVRTGLRSGREVVEVLHDRIRETIVDQLPPDAVRAYHARIALALETLNDPDPEAVALHLFGAGEKARGGAFAERAAQAAAEKLAFAQAVRLYNMALETVPDDSEDARRLRVALARLLDRAGRGPEAATVYAAAAEGASGLERIELEREAAKLLLVSGRVDEGARGLERIVETAGLRWPRSVTEAVLWLLVCRAWIRLVGVRFRPREPRDVRPRDHGRIEALYAVVIGMSLVSAVYGVCMQARHLLLALRRGDRFQVLRAIGLQATNLAGAGGPESRAELALLALARRLVEESGDQSELSARHYLSTEREAFAAFEAGVRGVCLFFRGRWRDAHEALLEAMQTSPLTLAGWNVNAQLFAIYACFNLGRLAELRAQQSARLEDALEMGDLYTSVNLRIGHTNAVWLAIDDVDTARRHLREAMGSWSQNEFYLQHYRALLAEANIDLYAGAGARAYELVRRRWRSLERSLLLHIQLVRADVHFLRARCALASLSEAGDRAARIAEAEALARRLDRERMDWIAPLAAIVWGSVHAARGDRAAAVARLRQAASLADAADMALYAAAARLQAGVLLGGDEGRDLAERARRWMSDQGVRAPDRFAATFVPATTAAESR